MKKLGVGGWVNVCDGWCCGAQGRVDFIDEKGDRALIDFGGGRKGGLTWVPRRWLRDFTGEELEGCAVPRSGEEK